MSSLSSIPTDRVLMPRLHEPILAEGEAEAFKMTRERLKTDGWTEQQIDNWLGRGSERAASMPTDVADQQRLADLFRFYSIMENLKRRIGGVRKLGECSGRMEWPKRGVYFFYEDGEYRSHTGDGLRVVRVGTHAVRLGSASTLWGRLRQHKGSLSGGGNHRGLACTGSEDTELGVLMEPEVGRGETEVYTRVQA
jgi:hypothetical protein